MKIINNSFDASLQRILCESILTGMPVIIFTSALNLLYEVGGRFVKFFHLMVFWKFGFAFFLTHIVRNYNILLSKMGN